MPNEHAENARTMHSSVGDTVDMGHEDWPTDQPEARAAAVRVQHLVYCSSNHERIGGTCALPVHDCAVPPSLSEPVTPEYGGAGSTLREQALRDAYWAHREVPGRHRGECCQDPCFADITERWVALVTERAALAAQPAEGLDDLRIAARTLFEPMQHGSPSKPNAGHTPESHCAECVRLRSKRTQAIRRALVALGDMPSVALRSESPDSEPGAGS